jgi:hypothetical protein
MLREMLLYIHNINHLILRYKLAKYYKFNQGIYEKKLGFNN